MGNIHWTTLSEVSPRPVQWLWEGRVPFAKVTLIDGEPGAGKSLLALDLAARVTRGAPMPLSRVRPANAADVVLYNDDDNLADTVRPRLEAAGADLARVRSVDGPITPADLQEIRPSLIIIDPLATYLCLQPGEPPRQVLKDLARLALETGAALLAVQNLPGKGDWASEVFDAARSVLKVSTIGHGRHRLAVTKSNLRAPSDVEPLVYQFEGTQTAVKIAGWADSV